MKGRNIRKLLSIFLCLCFVLVAVPAVSVVFAAENSQASGGERTFYSYSGRGAEGVSITHLGIVAPSSGFMDLNVSTFGDNAAITVRLVSEDTGEVAATGNFSDTGSGQYFIGDGAYRLDVTFDSGEGDCSYQVDLLMPEAVAVSLPEEVTPLAAPISLTEEDPAGLGTPWTFMIVLTAIVLAAVGFLSYRRIRKNN